MKAYLIKAAENTLIKRYKQFHCAPPQSIFSMAAATPSWVDLRLTDETMDMRVDYAADADMVVVFTATADALRAYDIARTFRAKDVFVVLAGIHPSFMPEEAAHHADAIIIGETEGVWEQLLLDFKKGSPQKRYQEREPYDLALLNPFPRHLLRTKAYSDTGAVLVSRGCGDHCLTCHINPFFKKLRFRRHEDIIQEIRLSDMDSFALLYDSLGDDSTYAHTLFKQLQTLNIQWVGKCDKLLLQDKELLKSAQRSGLSHLQVDVNALLRNTDTNLSEPPENYYAAMEFIREVNDLGIGIEANLAFGHEEHTHDVFVHALELCKEAGFSSLHSYILTPYPGMPFFNQLKDENRIRTENWMLYDGEHAVFNPKHMSAKELERGVFLFQMQIMAEKDLDYEILLKDGLNEVIVE